MLRTIRKPNIFCKIGIHRPLTIGNIVFIDQLTENTVYDATCSCGIEWFTDSCFGWFGYRIRKDLKCRQN